MLLFTSALLTAVVGVQSKLSNTLEQRLRTTIAASGAEVSIAMRTDQASTKQP